MERDSFSRFFAEFMQESDRAALVLGAAQMDALLETILTKRLVDPKTDMFDFNGPFGTFSAKIEGARATGVIDKDFADKLHLVRRIRNECAHDIQRVDLSTPAASQRIAELCRSFSNSKFWTEGLQWTERVFEKSGNALALRFAVGCLVANLAHIIRDVKQVDVSAARSVFTPRE